MLTPTLVRPRFCFSTWPRLKPGIDHPGFTRGVNLFARGLPPPGMKMLLRQDLEMPPVLNCPTRDDERIIVSSRLWGSPQDLPRAGPFAIKNCSAEGEPGKGLQNVNFTLSGAPQEKSPQTPGDCANSPGSEETIGIAWEVPRGGRWEARRESPGGIKGHFRPGGPRKHVVGGTREAGDDHFDSRGHQGGRKGPCGQPRKHQGGRKGPFGQLWTAWEAPGRQERTTWTAGRHQGGTRDHQGGRKGPCGEPRKHQGGTREAGKDHMDSLGGTKGRRKGPFGQPGRHQGGTRDALGFSKAILTREAGKAPGRHQGGRIGLIGQPVRHQGGRKGPIGQPGRHQGGTREAPGRQERHQGWHCLT